MIRARGITTPPPCGPDTPAAQDPDAAAAPSATVPAAEQGAAARWEARKTRQRLTGPDAN